MNLYKVVFSGIKLNKEQSWKIINLNIQKMIMVIIVFI